MWRFLLLWRDSYTCGDSYAYRRFLPVHVAMLRFRRLRWPSTYRCPCFVFTSYRKRCHVSLPNFRLPANQASGGSSFLASLQASREHVLHRHHQRSTSPVDSALYQLTSRLPHGQIEPGYAMATKQTSARATNGYGKRNYTKQKHKNKTTRWKQQKQKTPTAKT